MGCHEPLWFRRFRRNLTRWLVSPCGIFWCLFIVVYSDLLKERDEALHRRRERIGYPDRYDSSGRPNRFVLRLDKAKETIFAIFCIAFNCIRKCSFCFTWLFIVPLRPVFRSCRIWSVKRAGEYGKDAVTSRPARSRPRALTLPLAEPDRVRFVRFRKRQRTDLQEGSMLFSRLPKEMRLAIWKYAVGGVDCHFYQLVEKERRKRRDVVVYVDEDLLPPGTPLGRSVYKCVESGEWKCEAPASCGLLEAPTIKRGLLSLMLTCRMAYSEAINIPYQHNRFIFDPHTLPRLFRTSSTAPPHRLAPLLLRRLHLSWPFPSPVPHRDDEHRRGGWPAACRALATLPALRELTILVLADRSFATGIAEGKPAAGAHADALVGTALKPLLAVKLAQCGGGGGGVFDVLVPWPRPRAAERVELRGADGAPPPFRVVRYDLRAALAAPLEGGGELKRDYVLHVGDPVVGGGEVARGFRGFWVTRKREDWEVPDYFDDMLWGRRRGRRWW